MRTRIVKIGNSHGIRIPKLILEETGIAGDVELEVSDNQIIIRPVGHPREGWEAAFKKMAKKGHDTLFDDVSVVSHSWDEDEWEW